MIWGQAWDADNQEFDPRTNTYWGTVIETGDINNDGLCDLIAGNYFYPTGNNNNEDGAVFVYLGQEPENFSLGGVSSEPDWAIIADIPDYDDDEFGRYLQVADVDQDDKDDLLITQWRYASNNGRLSLFLGSNLDEQNLPLIQSVDDHDWHVEGSSSGDYLGSRSIVTDTNGDGVMDIILSGPQAGSNKVGVSSNQRVGLVSIYLGQLNDVPQTLAAWSSPGDVLNDWWGNSFQYFERPQNNNMKKGLAVLAAKSDRDIIFFSISLLQLRAAVFNPEKDISKLLVFIRGLGRLIFLHSPFKASDSNCEPPGKSSPRIFATLSNASPRASSRVPPKNL